MSMPAVYPCLGCKRPTVHRRCKTCQAALDARIDARRGSAAARGLGSDWRRVRDAAKAAHLAVYGEWCPGMMEIGHASHPCLAARLTGDHIIPRSRGGTNDPSNCRITCGWSNSARGAGT